tara:strand:- start:271 stop:1272 length:1002 start_codon:yes stop_codon:yes gene_type:complete
MNNISKKLIDRIAIYFNKSIDSKYFFDNNYALNKNKELIIFDNRINNIKDIDKFHQMINKKIENGCIYITCLETNQTRYLNLRKNYQFSFLVVYFFDFLFNRLIPRLPIIKKIYFFITKGKNQAISKSEALGRLLFCGFQIIDFFEIDNLCYIISKKNREPNYNLKPSYGIIFKMKRIGYQGKKINLYKLRTMHPYSEFLQEYLNERFGLNKDGDKINNDFRVTKWGKFLRKYWIDELPQLLNFVKGELDMVGVRALTQAKFKTYPIELQELRIKVKPGLIPPYYVDLPKNREAFYESEIKFIKSKIKNPFLTSVKYFYLAIINILFKGARSK